MRKSILTFARPNVRRINSIEFFLPILTTVLKYFEYVCICGLFSDKVYIWISIVSLWTNDLCYCVQFANCIHNNGIRFGEAIHQTEDIWWCFKQKPMSANRTQPQAAQLKVPLMGSSVCVCARAWNAKKLIHRGRATSILMICHKVGVSAF